MPNFRFRYVDHEGASHTGESEARDEHALVHDLQSKGTVLEVHEVTGGEHKAFHLPHPRLFQTRFSRESLALFTRQVATMLVAGLPLMKVLAIKRKRCPNAAFAQVLDEVSSGVQGGRRLSECLASHPDYFDGMYISLVKVGEASGKLPQMVDRLAGLLDREVALNRRVKSAMAYPGFILGFTVLLSWLIVAFLMPLFAPMFASAGFNLREKYPLTWFLLELGKIVNNPIGMVVSALLLVGAVGGFRQLLRTPRGKALVDAISMRIPVINTLLQNAIIARFARSLSTLMGSGLPLLQCMSLIGSAVGNAIYARALDRVSGQISKGSKISDAIESESRVFPELLIEMVQTGEESGALTQMLERAAEYYEAQLDQSVGRLVAVLEPAMMVLVGIIVCGFVMAVLLPILGMAQITQ